MAKLIRNVAVQVDGDTVWFGPAYGNAEAVPDGVVAQLSNPAVWDEPPFEVVESATADDLPGALAALVAEHGEDASGGQHTEGVAPVAVAPVVDEAGAAPSSEAGAEAAPEFVLPESKEGLLAFADARGIDVNRRLGVEKLRAAINAALAAEGSS